MMQNTMETETDKEWEIGHYFFERTLLDGTRARGLLARSVKYRLPTKDEEAEYVSIEAW